ncbi:MAG: hypothetical protein IH957_05730 [Chloroflexi bacterium]|nr:hypothetical protein [Chloroflexota bacterium]
MAGRKLRVYGDADLEVELEQYFRDHKSVNYESARDLGYAGHEDEHHYREALKRRRLLVTHDGDYLNDSKFPLQETDGVLVLKRGQNLEAQTMALEKFLRWVWVPIFRDDSNYSALGHVKVELSGDGYHWWMHTTDGNVEEGYDDL